MEFEIFYRSIMIAVDIFGVGFRLFLGFKPFTVLNIRIMDKEDYTVTIIGVNVFGLYFIFDYEDYTVL